MPITSRYPSMPIPESVDYWTFLLTKIRGYNNRPCLTDGVTRSTVTYAEFVAMVTKARKTLWSKGLRKGDVFMNLTPNCIEAPVVMCACLSIGVIYSTCNPSNKPNEVEYQITESGATSFAVPPSLIPLLNTALNGLKPKLVISYGVDHSNGLNTISFDALLSSNAADVPSIEIHPKKDIGWMLFSSGTTGKPKGVLLSHFAIIANVIQADSELNFFDNKDSEALILFLPFFHIYGMFLFGHALSSGKNIVMMQKFQLKAYLDLITEYKTPLLAVAPPVALLLTNTPMSEEYDLSFIKQMISGAAPLPQSVEEALKRRIPSIKIRQSMGMTEIGCALTAPLNSPTGASGQLLPNMCGKIIDITTGEELGPHREGEILFHGPQIMLGYLNNEEATKKTLSEEDWISTGDIGYYDEYGFFFITDRLKEVIKCKGFQVVPSLLESLLLEHEAVADAAVIGIPDKFAGEVPKAFVVLKQNKKTTTEELKQFVAERVAPYKQLAGGVEFVDSIPKSPSGKILRKILKKSNMNTC